MVVLHAPAMAVAQTPNSGVLRQQIEKDLQPAPLRKIAPRKPYEAPAPTSDPSGSTPVASTPDVAPLNAPSAPAQPADAPPAHPGPNAGDGPGLVPH